MRDRAATRTPEILAGFPHFHKEKLKELVMEMKVCSTCGRELPATTEYFYQDKRRKKGLKSPCKKCAAKRDAKYRAGNKERIGKYYAKYHTENRERKAKYHAKYRKSPAKYHPELEKYEWVYNTCGYTIVKCAYCGKLFSPTNSQVQNRIQAINGAGSGECRIYCSGGCRMSCPTYHRKEYPKGFKKATSREANPFLRQLVLKRDNYTCQKCGATEYLHCHHVVPATQNPMTANDPDACTTLCKSCHKTVHQKDGCKYHELKCEAGHGQYNKSI